jgi:hypothetical protein
MKRLKKDDPTPASQAARRRQKPAPSAAQAASARTGPTPFRSDADERRSHDPEVTYKKPPKKGRWPKGRSGNPQGRRKGSKNKKTIIIEMMESKLGRKIPDPKKLSRYEAMMFKGIQQALGGCIRSMGFVLGEYRKAIESGGAPAAAATTEEDLQVYQAFRAKIRREIEEEVGVQPAGNPKPEGKE